MVITKKFLKTISDKRKCKFIIFQEYNDNGSKRAFSLDGDIIDSKEKIKYITKAEYIHDIYITHAPDYPPNISGMKYYTIIEKKLSTTEMIIKTVVLEEIIEDLPPAGFVVFQEYNDNGSKRSFSLKENVIDSEGKANITGTRIIFDVKDMEIINRNKGKTFIIIKRLRSS